MDDVVEALRRLDEALHNAGLGCARLTLASWEDLAVFGTLGLRRDMLAAGGDVAVGGLSIDAPTRQRDCTLDNRDY